MVIHRFEWCISVCFLLVFWDQHLHRCISVYVGTVPGSTAGTNGGKTAGIWPECSLGRVLQDGGMWAVKDRNPLRRPEASLTLSSSTPLSCAYSYCPSICFWRCRTWASEYLHIPWKYRAVGVLLGTRFFVLLKNIWKSSHSWSLPYLCRHRKTRKVGVSLGMGTVLKLVAPEVVPARGLPEAPSPPWGDLRCMDKGRVGCFDGLRWILSLETLRPY